MKEFGWFAVIAGAVILEVLTAPGTARSGQEWKLSSSGAPAMVHFTVERTSPGRRQVESSDVRLADFHGFSLDMLDHGGPAKFTYVQDAGTLQCEGRFAWGRGSGSFTLKPNPAFLSELNRLGFSTPREDDLYLMMLSKISLDFVREVRGAGIATELPDILDMAAHGVSLAYIHDMNRAGYRNFRAHDYIEMHDHGVKAQFAEDLKQAGYDIPVRQIIELRDHGIDSNFVRDLGLYGLRPRAPELVELHDHGVTPDYLRGLHDAGYGAISAGEIIELRDHGVPIDFVKTVRDLDYHFTTAELIELRDHGVDGKYLRTIHDSGMKNLNGGQIVQLRDHGVE